MKTFLFFIWSLIFCFVAVSCDQKEIDGYQEEIVTELTGIWVLEQSIGEQGTVEFTKDCQIILNTKKGCAIGDYSEYADENGNIAKNSIAITYLEDEDGNYLLTEEDEENGGIMCTFQPLDSKNIYVQNLPFYRQDKILLIKQTK